MRVVDVRDFCVPSDENDYGELVAFADTMASIPQFDAVPIDVLDKIRAEILAMMPPLGKWIYEEGHIEEQITCEVIADVLQIIDKYKAESEAVE